MLQAWLKRGPSSSGDDASPKQPKRPREAEAGSAGCSDPCTVVTWNANGLMARVKSDLPKLQQFVRERDPDVLCVQEARVKAHCSNPKAKVGSADARDRSRPLASEAAQLRPLLEVPPLNSYRASVSSSPAPPCTPTEPQAIIPASSGNYGSA